MEKGGMERLQSEWQEYLCVIFSGERFYLGPIESMPIYYQKLDLELKSKLNKIQEKKVI